MLDDAVPHCLVRLTDFEGRTSRAHFMAFANGVLLPLLIISLLGFFVYVVLVTSEGELLARRGAYFPAVLSVIRGAGLTLVVLAVALLASATVRRLHDAGKSGWWYGVPAAIVAAYCLLYAGGKLGLGAASLLLAGLELPLRIAAFAAWMMLMVFLRLPGQPQANLYGPPPPEDALDPGEFDAAAAAERVDARVAALLAERAKPKPAAPPRSFGRHR